jgi:F420H(2)-dependent quinone reductase
MPVDGGLVIIASNFGQTRHPAWFYNLRAEPAAETCVDGRRTKVIAVEAEGERRAAIWQQALEVYPGYQTDDRRATNRPIIVFVLEPACAPAAGSATRSHVARAACRLPRAA